MAETYEKKGDYLEIAEVVTKSNMVTYQHILDNIANLETELVHWNNLKTEADRLGVVLVPEGL